ncbi:MAG: DUF2642 domain-containing protein [Bacillota bacterium]|nr:DUF2642 domain-containing protein [Bacillota bacterium]
MKKLQNLIGQKIELEVSGKVIFQGILKDLGQDILVLFNGKDYFYIPLIHVHNLRVNDLIELESSSDVPASPINDEQTAISYRKTLLNAKGRFVEIFVTGNKSLHGYVTNVLNDYFSFYSPIYKTMLISLNHLKWLTPYQTELTPYTLDQKALPVKPLGISLQRSLEEQIKKLEGNLVVFDIGDHPFKIGLLKLIQDNIAELVVASGETVYWKVSHLKTIHTP